MFHQKAKYRDFPGLIWYENGNDSDREVKRNGGRVNKARCGRPLYMISDVIQKGHRKRKK